MFTSILLVPIVIFSLLFLYFSLKNKPPKNIPGPPKNVIFGNLLDLGTTDCLQKLLKILRQYGDVFRIWIGPFRNTIFIANPEIIQYFLTSTTEIYKSSTYDLIKPFNGLISSNGNKWKQVRKILEPGLHFNFMEAFLSIFNNQLVILRRQIDKNLNRRTDVKGLISVYSFDCLCESTMGIEMNSFEIDQSYINSFQYITNVIFERIFSILNRSELYFKLTSKYTEYKKNIEVVNKLAENIIQKAHRLKKNNHEVKTNNYLIDHFINALSDHFTEADIKREIFSFLFAGQDTVSTTMSLALYEIAKNPLVQERLYDEISQLVSEKTSLKDIQKLTYLDMVFKETLRKYPPAIMIERCVQKNVKIGKYEFSKGNHISLFLYGLHHNEEYYPEPNVFNPERIYDRVPYTYYPFSAGPRNCIGQRFAKILCKATIANLVLNYQLSTPEDFHVQLAMNIALYSTNGIQIKFSKR